MFNTQSKSLSCQTEGPPQTKQRGWENFSSPLWYKSFRPKQTILGLNKQETESKYLRACGNADPSTLKILQVIEDSFNKIGLTQPCNRLAPEAPALKH